MDSIVNWYRRYNLEITWFIIGWLAMAGLDQLAREHYIMSLIDFGLAYFNYRMWRKNRV